MAAFLGNNNVFKKTCIVIIMGVTLFLTLISFQPAEAGRPLGRIELWLKENHLIIQSLPRGSGGTPSPNPCTYIPGTTKGRCTLEAENEAGAHLHASHAPPPPAFPDFMVQLGDAAAPKENGTHDDHPKKDDSSS